METTDPNNPPRRSKLDRRKAATMRERRRLRKPTTSAQFPASFDGFDDDEVSDSDDVDSPQPTGEEAKNTYIMFT
ncbi:unnamed protein product [Nippostrongylus brasiliensis]|uniref:Intraflagellar transport protein 46 homolog n=1 Tax=Nippostrongylus brasiliensis TaxID=27835 RepID=A0A0N4YRY3_NIPBR|nr:unnamed protein product [Nippostrongylus brasiliensis]